MSFDYDAELNRYHQRLMGALDINPEGQVLDIGCGTGLATREAAKVATGAVGVDVSAQMVATARRLSAEQDVQNVRFEQADAQTHDFPGAHFDLAISRFGTMFFTDPAAAFANIASALRPGAHLVQLVWQAQRHQEWSTVIQHALGAMPSGGEAFSLADLPTTQRLLTDAGFTDIHVTDVQEPVYYGPDAGAARDAALSLLVTQDHHADPDEADHARRRLDAAYAAHETADGVWLDSRAWLITSCRNVRRR